MSKIQFTMQCNRKFCQFNKVQYCTARHEKAAEISFRHRQFHTPTRYSVAVKSPEAIGYPGADSAWEEMNGGST